MKLWTLFLFVACSHHVPTIRSSYELREVNGFLITNIYVNPHDLEYSNEDALINYELIAKNVRSSERSISLSKSSIVVRGISQPMKCEDLNKKEDFKVQSQETVRIFTARIFLSKLRIYESKT